MNSYNNAWKMKIGNVRTSKSFNERWFGGIRYPAYPWKGHFFGSIQGPPILRILKTYRAVKLIGHFACESNFPAFRFHTYRTESKDTYKFDIEPCGQNEMAPKLSYKYEIEKQKKSLSQAKCPISLTVL